jgi:hypothetical protein
MKKEFNFDSIQFLHNSNNMELIQKLLSYYISNHRKYINSDVIRIHEYEKQAMLDIDTLKFVDRFLPDCLQVNKIYGFDEDNLSRNNLMLEKVILERLFLQKNGYIIQFYSFSSCFI